MPHTWLFCVEIQLAILFIPILALREQIPQLANLLNCILIVVGYVVNVTTVSRLRLPPTFLLTLPDPGYVTSSVLIQHNSSQFVKI